jgi:hypothetical protein
LVPILIFIKWLNVIIVRVSPDVDTGPILTKADVVITVLAMNEVVVSTGSSKDSISTVTSPNVQIGLLIVKCSKCFDVVGRPPNVFVGEFIVVFQVTPDVGNSISIITVGIDFVFTDSSDKVLVVTIISSNDIVISWASI